jgi:hypothetical protein
LFTRFFESAESYGYSNVFSCEQDVLSYTKEYGMGSKRSLDMYMAMAEMDIKSMKVSGHLGWCAKGDSPPMAGWSYS